MFIWANSLIVKINERSFIFCYTMLFSKNIVSFYHLFLISRIIDVFVDERYLFWKQPKKQFQPRLVPQLKQRPQI